ncbi:unnamed protein product [Agarophyton chilense]
MICRKVFENEHFLDKHFARKHADVRDKATSVCLADLCGSNIPCVPLTRRPLPRVISASLRLSDEGQDIEFHEIKDYCEEKTFRQRRIAACSEVVKECLRDAIGQAPAKTRRKHTERLRWDICDKAVMVDCIPRERIWEKLGGPKDVLTISSHDDYWFTIACAIAIVMSALFIFLASTSRSGHPNRARTLRRKQGKRE